MKKNYIYIGVYLHIKGKKLPLDYKFGVTDNINDREYSLSRTKSPIKYVMVKAWELGNNIHRESVEDLIATYFSDCKYNDGKNTCEWYDGECEEEFIQKVTNIINILSTLYKDSPFTEVDLNNNNDPDSIVDKKLREEILSEKGKTLRIKINENLIEGNTSKSSFINFIKYLFENYNTENVLNATKKTVYKKNEEGPKSLYPQHKIKLNNDYWMNSWGSNKHKIEKVKKICSNLNIDTYSFEYQ